MVTKNTKVNQIKHMTWMNALNLTSRNRDAGRCRAADAAAKSLQLRETNRHFSMPNDFEGRVERRVAGR